jgi:hypothetical protein
VTIHRIYAENGNRADFWVQHRSWVSACGHVRSIAGQLDGPLRGNEDSDDVSMRLFDIRSGRPISSQPTGDYRDDRNYTRIAEPNWSHGLEKGRARAH